MFCSLALDRGGGTAFGQVATGIPPFSSNSGSSFDTVDNANLNVHFSIPVVAKVGRGLPFDYVLSFDSSIWSPVSPSGGAAWTPTTGWGWSGAAQPATGSLDYNQVLESCYWPKNQYGQTYYFNEFWITGYTDPSGTLHPFAVQVSGYTGTPCQGYPFPPNSASATTSDGSGYALQASAGGGQYGTLYASVTGVSGTAIVPPLPELSSTVTDSNGNQLTAAYSGNTTTFTDTLGVTALTVSGAGTPASPVVYSYPNPSGGTSQVTVEYTASTVGTSFGCSGISEFKPAAENLVSSIALPDGTSYNFTYDSAGRVTSATLPTGGTTHYAYSGGYNGITCSDGSTATLTRTTPGGIWTYTHAESGNAWTTTVTDPQGNQTVYQFQGIYETERQIYQGTSSLLETVDTCYNGSAAPCTGTAVTLPITQRSVTVTLAGVSSPAETVSDYNSYGLPTETDVYDYGPTLVRKTVITYASPGNNIQDRPASITVENASSTPVAESSYSYDSKGNLLTLSENTAASSAISRGFTYGTGGVLNTATDFSGNTTTFTYGDCSSSFPTSIAQPLGLTSSLTWDCNTGLVTSVTDPNSQTTNFSYDDLYRLTQTNYPDGGQVSAAYNDTSNPVNVVTTAKLSASQNRVDTTVLDGLARVTETQLNSDPAGIDKIDTAYDQLGRVASVTNPYRGSPNGSTSYAYDALGRVTSVAYTDGSAATTSYSGNCATSTDPAVKKREICTNALGEITKVVEDPGGLNYETDYAYDALGNLVSVNDGGQTRSYNYDMLSRLVSATTPESGTTTYSYSGCSGDPSNVCTRTDARGIVTTYHYDALNRLTAKSYSDGTPVANYWYDANRATLTNWSVSGLTNTAGRLYATCTSNAVLTCAAGYTGTVYSYDSMGRIKSYWQATPYNDGSSAWQMTYNYDLGGDVTSWTHPAGFTITNTVNAAQEITQITSSLVDANHPQYLAQNITYTPWGAEQTLENGCSGTGCTNVVETYAYNNRMQPVMIELGNTSNASADYCLVYNYYAGATNPTSCTMPTQGTNDNGDVAGVFDQDSVNTSLSHTAAFDYDAVNRLLWAKASGNTTYTVNFSYDPFGNRKCQTSGGGGPTGGPNLYCFSTVNYSSATNRITNTGYTYDVAGDLTSDGTHSYQWDGEGRFAGEDSGATESLTYNAMGIRSRIMSQGTPVDLISNPEGKPLGQAGAYSVVWPLPDHAADIYYQGSDAAFFHANALGTTRMENNAGGGEAEDLLFYPWGQVWALSGGGGYNFASIPYRDVVSSLDLARFRNYSYGLGRWLSPDPLGGDITNPQSLNRYAYVLNNPTTLTDPSGLCPGCKLYEPPNLEGYDEFDFLFSTHPDGEGGFVTVLNPAGFAFVGNNFGLFHDSGTSIFGLPAWLSNSPAAAANSQTSACTVSNGRTTAPSPGQAPGPGAFGFVPPRGSVAVDPWALGLVAGPQTNALLGPYASQISFGFSPAPNLPPGFPATHTLGSVVGPANARAGGSQFNGLYDFDIFGLPSLAAARAATSPGGLPVSVTVTFPSSLPINCGGPLLDSPQPPVGPLSSSPAAVAARALRW